MTSPEKPRAGRERWKIADQREGRNDRAAASTDLLHTRCKIFLEAVFMGQSKVTDRGISDPSLPVMAKPFSGRVALVEEPGPFKRGSCFWLLEQILKPPDQVCLQVLPVLDSNTNPQYSGIDCRIAHTPPLDQALHSSQAGSVMEQGQQARQFSCHPFFSSPDGEDGAKPVRHLPLQPRHVFVLQRCMLNLFHNGFDQLGFLPPTVRIFARVEPLDKSARILTLPFDPQVERSQTPHAEPTLHVPHHTAKEHSILAQARKPFVFLGGKHTAKHVAVTAQVFGPAMHHHVGAPFKRVLKTGRPKGRINEQYGSTAVCFICVFRDVVGFPGGIEWSFEMDDVSWLEIGRRAMERKHAGAAEPLLNFEDAMSTVVTVTDGDAAWVQVDIGGMESCKT